MKALFYMGEKQLELKDAPAPTGEFVLRVTGCTLCGTDLKTWLKGHPMFTPPCILGHEFIGVVERAPEVWQRLGLEWLHRLLKQPSRIGRMMKLPKFIFAVIISRFRG